MNTKAVLKMILTLTVISIIVGYSYYKSKDFIIGPTIIITSPQTGDGVSESLIEILGIANSISYISINDRQIFTNEEGEFREKLLLFSGYNIISIKARDKFDRKIEKILEIVYKAPIEDETPKNTATTTLKSNIKSDHSTSTKALLSSDKKVNTEAEAEAPTEAENY